MPVGIVATRRDCVCSLRSKLVSEHSRDQKGFPYNYSFIRVIPRNCCKETPTHSFNAEKIAEGIFLYVFQIVFSVSLFIFCVMNARKQRKSHSYIGIVSTFYRDLLKRLKVHHDNIHLNVKILHLCAFLGGFTITMVKLQQYVYLHDEPKYIFVQIPSPETNILLLKGLSNITNILVCCMYASMAF